jgi:hypothetical protein
MAATSLRSRKATSIAAPAIAATIPRNSVLTLSSKST